MSNETPTLPASLRERTGSRYARRLRSAGKLPAVLYGQGSTPVSIAVDDVQILRHLSHGVRVFELDIEGHGTQTCLVKDLQFGWLGDNVIHVDLTKVDLDEMVTIKVRLHFKGSPKGLKATGSVLKQDLNELEVTCKVRDIPEEILVQMDDMEESLTVGELNLPDGVTPADADARVCHIIFKAAGASDDEDGEDAEGESDEA